jgi:hypothetical protein
MSSRSGSVHDAGKFRHKATRSVQYGSGFMLSPPNTVERIRNTVSQAVHFGLVVPKIFFNQDFTSPMRCMYQNLSLTCIGWRQCVKAEAA